MHGKALYTSDESLPGQHRMNHCTRAYAPEVRHQTSGVSHHSSFASQLHLPRAHWNSKDQRVTETSARRGGKMTCKYTRTISRRNMTYACADLWAAISGLKASSLSSSSEFRRVVGTDRDGNALSQPYRAPWVKPDGGDISCEPDRAGRL